MPNNIPLITRQTLTFTLSGSTLTHPQQEIEQLVEALEPHGETLKLPSGQKLYSKSQDEQVCYILKNGYLSFRKHEDGSIVTYAYPPLVINLGEMFTQCSAGYLRAEGPALVLRVTKSAFERCLEERPELWRNVTLIMAYTIHRLFIRDAQISTKNAYQIVRNLLLDLSEQPIEIRHKVSASRYILDRAPISRSTVMYIISELQRGEFVVMMKGGYLDTIKKLPEHF